MIPNIGGVYGPPGREQTGQEEMRQHSASPLTKTQTYSINIVVSCLTMLSCTVFLHSRVPTAKTALAGLRGCSWEKKNTPSPSAVQLPSDKVHLELVHLTRRSSVGMVKFPDITCLDWNIYTVSIYIYQHLPTGLLWRVVRPCLRFQLVTCWRCWYI